MVLLTGALAACEDSRQPILRGAKQDINSILKHFSEDAKEAESEVFDEADTALNSAEVPVAAEHRETAKRILNLNLPDDIKHGDVFAKTEVQWRQHALVGEDQTFPNFFEYEVAPSESAVDFSGKVHWQEEAEELTIPPLNTIEGLELEISVKTR